MTILVFGSINMDLVSHVPHLPAPGETVAGVDFFTAPGGKGANQAVSCARLGMPTLMVGRVGDDVFGSALRTSLNQYGVDIQQVLTTPGSSGLAVIHVDDNAENSIVIIPGANGKVGSTDLEHLETVLRGASTLLLQLEVPLDAVVQAARLARAEGIRIILDPAPARSIPDELFALTDIITPNETETTALIGAPVQDLVEIEEAARTLLDRGVQQVVIKLGARGAYAHDGSVGRLIPAFSVSAVDTTAAGDAFNGALAAALEKGMTLFDAVRFANAAGALSATRRGAQESMPDAGAIETFLTNHTKYQD
jgi:ribokinase